MLSIGYVVDASSYDYSASIECLDEPQVPQYNGGILVNPRFENGLEGWGVHGHGKIEVRKSTMGNRFIVAYDRTQPHDSFSQNTRLMGKLLYTFSAWVQINRGKEMVVAAYKNSRNQTITVGSVLAQSGCWSLLKGGISVDITTSVDLYFQGNNTSIELWVDNVSLQSFTKAQWREHQFQSIEKVRKRKVRFHITNKQGNKTYQGAKITFTLKQERPHFPLGCALSSTIINNNAYQTWFASRFTATTFDNEMKWYYTEPVPGQENYSDADAMLAFAQQHNILVRGHNIFWDNPTQNKEWVKSLSPEKLMEAALHRMDSVVSRYADKVIAWDVMNENLHFSFFEDKLGPNASALFYKKAHELDSKAIVFLNEFNTLEHKEDSKATPAKYLEKVKEIRSFSGKEDMVVGIGLQGHFGKPNVAYMRACLDILGAAKLPIWLTELDVERSPNQANYLEEIMREAYSHPAVQGIIVWSGWKPTGCSNMCLFDNNFKNLPAGDVVDKLIEEWKTKTVTGETDVDGVYEDHIFHGEYSVTVSSSLHNNNNNSTLELKQQLVMVDVSRDTSEPLNVWISI